VAIYAISDLHLSMCAEKPMEIFGEVWHDHARRIAANWDAIVKPEDKVIVAGDHSWALRFPEARPDLEWIAARPGTKLLIRGNHDYWWRREATNRIQRSIHESIRLVNGHAVMVDGVGITGTRGWRVESTEEGEDPGDDRVLNRELANLRRGLDEIPLGVTRKIVALHYPPFDEGLAPNAFAAIIEEYGVDTVVYGHIHAGSYLEGVVRGVDYRLVAVDHVGFRPVLISG
jgi:predicted phosphohydrolase